MDFLTISVSPEGVVAEQAQPPMGLFRFKTPKGIFWGATYKWNPTEFPPLRAFKKLEHDEAVTWKQGPIEWTLFRGKYKLKQYEK